MAAWARWLPCVDAAEAFVTKDGCQRVKARLVFFCGAVQAAHLHAVFN